MKRILRRRPSPALVVAAIALFATLGGTAYALTITGAQVRNNSLTGADIRNRSLTQVDLKGRALKGTLMIKDSVGYNAVKEQVLDASKFKQVNSAKNADRVGGVAVARVAPFNLNIGQGREIVKAGPLTLVANCRAAGPDHIAEILARTNENNSAVDGVQPDPDFDSGETAQLVLAQAPGGTPVFQQRGAVSAIAPSGAEIMGQELYAGVSVLGQINQCRFGGVVFTS